MKKPFFFDLDNMFINMYINKNVSFRVNNLGKLDTSVITKMGITFPHNPERLLNMYKIDETPNIELHIISDRITAYNNYYLGKGFLVDKQGNLLVLFGILNNSRPIILVHEKLSTGNKEDKIIYKRIMSHKSIFDMSVMIIKENIQLLVPINLHLERIPNINETMSKFLLEAPEMEILNLNEQIQQSSPPF